MSINSSNGISDWKAGRIWGQLAAVRDIQLCPRGPKGPQLTATLFDATGSRVAKSWDLSPEQITLLQATAAQVPPVLRVSGTVEATGTYAGEVTLEGLTPADPDEYEEEAFLEPLPDDHAVLVDGLDHLIRLVRNPHLSGLLARTIGPAGKFRAAFVTGVAAQKNHHAYRGGLLRHSLEVAEIALGTSRRFPQMSRDLIVTAALLHDIGKLWEMEHDWQQGAYTAAGSLHGHIQQGTERIGALCRKLQFPENLQSALIHILLSHHDELGFGSPVTPKTPEAIAIAKSDQISAELTAYYQAFETRQPGQTTVWKGNRSFFVGFSTGEEFGSLSDQPVADPEERLLHRLSGQPSFPLNFRLARLPIRGVVAAGDGIQSSAEEAETEERDVLVPEGGADFLLKVTGDSMTGAGIMEGDLLVVRHQEIARSGQIIIAYVPGTGSVVKRFTETPTGNYLLSENPDYAPIPIEDGVQVQGLVVRLEREM